MDVSHLESSLVIRHGPTVLGLNGRIIIEDQVSQSFLSAVAVETWCETSFYNKVPESSETVHSRGVYLTSVVP